MNYYSNNVALDDNKKQLKQVKKKHLLVNGKERCRDDIDRMLKKLWKQEFIAKTNSQDSS